MLNSTKKLTCLLALAVLASCAKPNPDACAGFRPVILLDKTAVYMNGNDPTALKRIIGNHETGQSRGCWK